MQPATTKASQSPAPVEEMVVSLALADLHESPTNPRKVFRDMDGLTDSIRRGGVQSPIVVRPRPAGGYEICFGHRRVRASQMASRTHIPGIVRDMSDEELEDAQLVENIQRSDITALEEADAYASLIKRGFTGEQIAAKTGKTKAFVYARVKLANLGEQGRVAFTAGRIDASIALLLARLPVAMQETALVEIVNRECSYREAVDYVRRTLAIPLARAAFALDDAKLVGAAGACNACPKNSANDADMRDQVGADVCTDSACWASKVDALYKIKLAKAKRAGGAELSAEQLEDVRVYGGRVDCYSNDLTLLDEEVSLPGRKEPIALRALLEAQDKVKPKILVGRKDGAIVECIAEADVDKLLEMAGAKKDRKAEEERYREQAKKADAKRLEEERKRIEVLSAFGLLVDRAGDRVPRWFWEHLLASVDWELPKRLHPAKDASDAQVRTAAIIAFVASEARNEQKAGDEATRAFTAAAALVSKVPAPVSVPAKVSTPAKGAVKVAPAKKGAKKATTAKGKATKGRR